MASDETIGLLSRENILQELDKALQEASSSGTPVMVSAIDIDRFRSLSVEHGSPFAEDLVQAVANVLIRTYGEDSRIGLHTTDEFMVVTTGVSATKGAELAENARHEVESMVLRPADAEENSYVRPTVSAGVSVFPADASTRAGLLHKAAEALQRAKHTGKNQVCLAADLEMMPKTIRLPKAQVIKLAEMSVRTGRPESVLLREALDDLFCKYQNGWNEVRMA